MSDRDGATGGRARRPRRGLAGAAALVLAAGAFTFAFAAGGGDDGGRRRVRVEPHDLTITADVEGVLRAVDTAILGPPAVRSQWNFKIAFLVPEGTEVEPGQPVLRFDTGELERRLQSQSAERDQAAKELEKRSAELEMERRDRELELAEAEAQERRHTLALAVPEDLKARHELEKTRIDHALAEREIAGLRAGLGHLARQTASELAALRGRRDRAAAEVVDLEAQIAAMNVVAPRAGTVLYVEIEPGVKPKVGDTVWRAATVVEIPDLRRMQAVGTVDESAMGRLRVGQPVRLRLDAHPDERFTGVLRKVHDAVKRRSPRDARKTVTVEIALTESDPQRLRPGMRFRGEVEVERIPATPSLPLAAVVSTPDGPAVDVAGPLGTRRLLPRLGRRDAQRIEVLGGLAVGDEVILPGDEEAAP